MTRVRLLWVSAFVFVVFSAGVATGVILYQRLQPVSLGGDRPMPPSASALVASFSEELDLTPAQEARLRQIVEARRRQLQARREELRAQMNDEATALDNEIRTKLDLTPEQRERFEAFVTRVRARFMKNDRDPEPR